MADTYWKSCFQKDLLACTWLEYWTRLQVESPGKYHSSKCDSSHV